MTSEDLELAAEWLDAYDDGDPLYEGMHAVADFLRAEAERRERASIDAKVRRLAKKTGVPVEKVRARLDALLAKS